MATGSGPSVARDAEPETEASFCDGAQLPRVEYESYDELCDIE